MSGIYMVDIQINTICTLTTAQQQFDVVQLQGTLQYIAATDMAIFTEVKTIIQLQLKMGENHSIIE